MYLPGTLADYEWGDEGGVELRTKREELRA
jgi:hypothetical protein